MDGDDGAEEFVLLTTGRSLVFAKSAGMWKCSGDLYVNLRGAGQWATIVTNLSLGKFGPVAPRWKNLAIGDL